MTNIPLELIKYCMEYIDWDEVTKIKYLKHSFIILFKHKLNWDYLTLNTIFFNKAMKEFKEYIIWDKYTFKYNKFTVKDIELIKLIENEKIWDNLCLYADFDLEFIKEFKHKINFDKLLINIKENRRVII